MSVIENKGLVYGLSREEYEALEGDNWSSIKRLARSPLHYRHAVDGDDEDTDARKFGRCVHLAILEPAEYARSVVTWEGGRRFGKEWDAFCAANEGREILTVAERERVDGIRKAVAGAEWLSPFVTRGKPEVSMVWATEVVPGFAIPCKGRLDYEAADALVDLKVTRNAAPGAFGRQCVDLQYLGQAAFYSDGYAAITGRRPPFVFVAVESQAPHCVAAYVVTEAQLAAGRAEYQRLLATLSLCRLDNRWPGYVTAPVPLELPAWVAKQAEETLNAERAEGAHVE